MNALLLALVLTQAEPTATPAVEAPPAEAPAAEAPKPVVDEFPRTARGTAFVAPKGRWSMGLFNPLTLSLTDGFEIEVHPVYFFIAPNLNARFGFLREGPVRVTVEAGLLVPTFAMRLTKGYLFPTWATSKNDIGWMVIPRGGLVISGDVREHDVWTLRADYSARILMDPNSASQLESFLAPLDLLFAPALTGFLGGFGGMYDAAIGRRLRVRAALNFYVQGSNNELIVDGVSKGPIARRDPFIVTGQLGLDVAVFKHSRIALGVYWANYDQGATAVGKDAAGFGQRVRVRSNNVLPMLDFIWAGGFGD